MIRSNWFWVLAASAVYAIGIATDDLLTVVIGAAIAAWRLGQAAAALRDR